MTSNRLTPVLVACAMAAISFAGAHTFNHMDRHEVCDIYADPRSHGEADGHAHWHHHDAVGAHAHDGVMLAANHTHTNVAHDPCNQVGMLRVMFFDAPAIPEVELKEAVIGVSTDSFNPTIIGREAFNLGPLTKQTNLNIRGDKGLAAMGLPGTGTRDDPYVIENYLVTGILSISDTNACVVVRNNVIHSQGIRGPLVDPAALIDTDALVAAAEGALAAAETAAADAQAALEALLAELAPMHVSNQDWLDRIDAAKDRRANSDYDRATYERAFADSSAALDQYLRDYDDLQAAYEEALAAASESSTETAPVAPAEPTPYSFAVYLQKFQAYVAAVQIADDRQQQVDELEAQLETYAGQFDAYHDAHDAIVQALLIARAEAYGSNQEVERLEAQYEVFLESYLPMVAAGQAAEADLEALLDAVDAAQWTLADAIAEQAKGAFFYANQVFATLDELMEFLLDGVNPPIAAGRLVLDWNAQCLHVYNNVVDDLRVNQNNARTGYATGGLLEDNRIYTIGQIRHYDGEFRQNEVGKREVLDSWLAGEPVPSVRVMNGDGFNEGSYHENVFYGRVELDLHGHHHGAGFFAPESHYHGSDPGLVYMKNQDGSYMTFGDAYGEHAGHHHNHEPTDRLPHHDHSKRWTSVSFSNNVVIDPLGAGIRYEDRNHAGDDRVANSEAVEELNRPHFHQTWIDLSSNAVVGSMWIDVFNADGIELWSDDYSQVIRKDLTGEIIDGLMHLGAEIVNSHHTRNDGWLDLIGNAVFTYDKDGGTLGAHNAWTAIQINDAKELTRAQIVGNQAYLLPHDLASDDATAFRASLAASPSQGTDANRAFVAGLGTGRDDGPTSTGILLARLRDSIVKVCDNTVDGFDRGMVATQRIYDDVALQTCGSNTWGDADPAVDVRFTPLPEDEPRLTDPLREVTDETLLRNVVNPVFDDVDTLG